MKAETEAAVRSDAEGAALVVAHGTTDGVNAIGRLAKRGLWRWVAQPRAGDNAAGGDWYIAQSEFASPVGGVLAGVPVESLPPLDMVLDVRTDSALWTGMVAQLDRRGRSRPVVVGTRQGTLRVVTIGATGFWRWASHGGVSEEGYRALTAALTDWLLEERSGAAPELVALRDSLVRGAGEFLPRRPSLAGQPGLQGAALGEPEPLRFSPWLYAAALAALVAEWVVRRRRGLR